MANVVTNTKISQNSKRVIYYITIDSDGSEETNLVLHDSSAIATAVGKADPLTCTIKSFYGSLQAAATTATAKIKFDADTDVLALALVPNAPVELDDLKCFGGLSNTAGTGITGDLTLTTTNLTSGDSIVIIMEVQLN